MSRPSEINSGIKAAPSERLKEWLDALQPNNAQAELYLTDIVESANKDDDGRSGIG